ncbi:MAG: GntR family transcriptional regulator [Velocimicrobium sp.]
MNINISNSSGVPIYEQITSQIKSLILSGTLKEGDTLPSMRLLAKELRISVITTKRSYEDLERDGFIQSFTGRGSFVSGMNHAFIREEHLKRIEEHLEAIKTEAFVCGISRDDIITMINIMYDEGDIV